MEDKIVLICATGRSGSTTLQRIIHSIPNSNMCGENNGSILSLLEFYHNLHIATKKIPGGYHPATFEEILQQGVKPSWYNSFHFSELEQHIRNTIISMFKKNENTILWGFKEIRYDNKKIKYIKYFKHLFPQTKIIFQVRENIQEQANSSWFKNDVNAKQKLIQTNNDFVQFYNENKEWCYFTTFERMFDEFNEETINDILKNSLEN